MWPIDESKYPGWHLFDLHSHTVNGIDVNFKKCDYTKYTHRAFYDDLIKDGVHLKAVTNHNTLELVDHVKQAIVCKLANVSYLPGIELDLVLENKKIFQTVLNFNPKMDLVPAQEALKEHLEKKRKLKEKKPETKLTFATDEFAKCFKNCEYVLIPHGTKTKGTIPNRFVPEQDSDTATWVIDSILANLAVPILIDNGTEMDAYKVAGILAQFSSSSEVAECSQKCVVCSDSTYNEDESRRNKAKQQAGYCMFAEPTYRGLVISIWNYKTRILCQTQLTTFKNHIGEFVFRTRDDSDFKCSGAVQLSPGLNVIIGNSGSGKTLLLNELFREQTGENLESATSKGTKSGRSAYEKKLNGVPIIDDIKTTAPEAIRVFEIAKIYDKVKGVLSNGDNIAALFGLFSEGQTWDALNGYTKRLAYYESYFLEGKNRETRGVDLLRSVVEDVKFVCENQGDVEGFSLNENPFNDVEKLNLQHIRDTINGFVEKTNSFILSVKEMLELFPDFLETADEINKNLYKTNGFLASKRTLVLRQLGEQEIKEKIYGHINRGIHRQLERVGSKNKIISEKKASILHNVTELSTKIREYCQYDICKNSIDCRFPLEELEKDAEKRNNGCARVRLGYSDSDLKGAALSESSVVDAEGAKRALKDVSFDLTNSEKTKEMIGKLLEGPDHIKVSTRIKREVPYTTEIKIKSDGDTWHEAAKINPGDLVKAYMNYYFQTEIRRANPNVIFIDQPENDLDKTFITDTLSRYIKDNKKTTQFIITTHDPILAVNSDANLIIEAKRNSKNQICYKAFPIERENMDGDESRATDIVGLILDGGVRNVQRRTQIYGGTLYEVGD